MVLIGRQYALILATPIVKEKTNNNEQIKKGGGGGEEKKDIWPQLPRPQV